jgi:sugar phosphate isomerase/epimerase
MKLAASNLTLPPFNHQPHLLRLRASGVEGVEVAPSNTWPGGARCVAPSDVTAYRRAVESAGLSIVGMHDVTTTPLDIARMADPSSRRDLMRDIVALSVICRDLGGRTLVIEGRRQGKLDDRSAWYMCRDFLEELAPRIEPHGTVLCFAPLPPGDGAFCATARECYMLANAVDHPSFGLHLAASAISGAGGVPHSIFAAVRGRLELFHIDEPGRTIVGRSRQVDHADLRRHLVASTYGGWVSVVQVAGAGARQARLMEEGLAFVRARYFPVSPSEASSKVRALRAGA